MGHALSLIKQQLFPHKSDFTADKIPDLHGQVVVVTGELHLLALPTSDHSNPLPIPSGGNSGIGKETVKVCNVGRQQWVIYSANLS